MFINVLLIKVELNPVSLIMLSGFKLVVFLDEFK